MTSLPAWPGWSELAPSARGLVNRLISLCGKRFTGSITIELRDGGVQEFKRTVRENGKQLEHEDLTE